jgi:ribonuclease BN (tRNA processing enzyme)
MRLRVLGSNATYPTPGSPASGYLVRHDKTSVMLDAGPATLGALQRVMSPAALDAIVVSHRHGDHCIDLFPLLNVLRFGPERARGLPVLAPGGFAEAFAAFLEAATDHEVHEVFRFRTVGAGDRVEIGPMTLTFGAASHPVPALATAVEAGGRRLVYSGDTGPDGDLEGFAAGADLLLCEATSQGEPGPGAYPYHLHAVQAGRIAAAAGVGRLLITHVAPHLDPTVSVREAASVFEGPVDWAAPDLEVAL